VNTGPIGGCIFYHVIRDPVHMPVFPRSASHHSAYAAASDACSSQPIADCCVSAGRPGVLDLGRVDCGMTASSRAWD
jgi:hypothetical protein